MYESWILRNYLILVHFNTTPSVGNVDHVYFVHQLTLDRFIGWHIGRVLTDMLVDISTDSWLILWPRWRMDRCINQDIDQVMVDTAADTRPICWPLIVIGRMSVDMSINISVDGCTKYTWSSNVIMSLLNWNFEVIQTCKRVIVHVCSQPLQDKDQKVKYCL